jgi:nitrate reductase gamma subunit
VWSMIFLQIVAYLSVLAFVGLIIAKAVRYATMPMHLRWELYPVAHETDHPSGGSYFENLDWWTKPRKVSLAGEYKFMGIELFFFESYYRLQRKYWYVVYPFHMGTFLLLAWLGLLLAGAITTAAGVSVSAATASIWGGIVYYATMIVGAAGFILATIGCIGLLVERLADENRRLYLSPIDYFILIFTLATLLSGLYAWVFYDRAFTEDMLFMKSLITSSAVTSVNPAAYINILLICLFLVYMPFTPMMHFVAKYFTYHGVRWNDAPNSPGSKLERKVETLLNRPVSWSAPHITSGKKWSENAVQIPNIGDTGARK